MEIWKLGSGNGGINQSIWVGETKGKRGYEIQATDVSNLDVRIIINLREHYFSVLWVRETYIVLMLMIRSLIILRV